MVPNRKINLDVYRRLAKCFVSCFALVYIDLTPFLLGARNLWGDEICGGTNQQLLFPPSRSSTWLPLQRHQGNWLFAESQDNIVGAEKPQLIVSLRVMSGAATQSSSTTSATISPPLSALRAQTATWRRWWLRARTEQWSATGAATPRSLTRCATQRSPGWSPRTHKWRRACWPCSSTTSGSSSPSCHRRPSSGWPSLRTWRIRLKCEESSPWITLRSLRTTTNAVFMWVLIWQQRLFRLTNDSKSLPPNQ